MSAPQILLLLSSIKTDEPNEIRRTWHPRGLSVLGLGVLRPQRRCDTNATDRGRRDRQGREGKAMSLAERKAQTVHDDLGDLFYQI